VDSSIPAKYLIASVALHFLCLIIFSQHVSTRFETSAFTEEAFTVETISPEELKRMQRPSIVSPPQNQKATVAPKNALLSDNDRTTQKETVKRGEPQSSPKGSQAQKAAIATKPKSEKNISKKTSAKDPKEATGKLRYLTLGQGEALKKFGDSSSGKTDRAQRPQAFSRPPGTGAAFQGAFGTQDYLPNLPDGDLTLLNTKANQFAVFVRRVALRVFQALKYSGWESLSARQIQAIEREVLVEAKLSQSGTLLSVKILISSGNSQYDQTVVQAVRQTANDPHPPPGAQAADGTITFQFASKTWSRMSMNPRTKAPFEQRWIFLGTGLE
jgi:TonB family protein